MLNFFCSLARHCPSSDEWLTNAQGSPGVRLEGRAVLVFHGVDSAFHIWVNGVLVGFAKGSRLSCEFDVTDALRGGTGEQCLCLRVVRWSDGSYLEDQDHWWLSGVYREVELALRPAPARIADFVARCGLSYDRAHYCGILRSMRSAKWMLHVVMPFFLP